MKFLADRNLGKLARELRMLGYDTVYYRVGDLHGLFHAARAQGRAILTRDTKIVPRRPGDAVIFLRENDPLLQLKELIRDRVITLETGNQFSRCLLCNAILEKAEPREVAEAVPDFVLHHQQDFFRCPDCRRIYWPGSHHHHMKKRMEELERNSQSRIPDPK